MTPRKQLVQRLHPSCITQKMQMTFKLLLLENARLELERELRCLSNEAFEEVQGFLNSSHPISVFNDLAEALDVKCQAIDKLTALLKDQTLKTQACVTLTVKNGMRAGQPQPLRDKRIVISDVLKFGPMLQNSLMASSITKAIRVLGSTLSNGRLNHVLISQPTVVEEKETVCSIFSTYDSAVLTTDLCCHVKAEEKETEKEVVLEVKCQPDALTVPPAIIQSHNINDERPPLLLPPIKAIYPETNNPKPKKRTPPISWGCKGDVQVWHQKQTSSQLLHFLRAKAKDTGPLEVTVMDWSRSYTDTSASPQSVAPPDQTQSSSLNNVADYLTEVLPLKTLFAHTENEAPVFRVKRIESGGSRTYTCVIATKTELWDVGDITTEVVEDSSEDNSFESTDCPGRPELEENSHKNLQCQTLTSTFKNPEHKDAEIGINIPKFHFQKFDESEVVVSHIVSPGSFYIQHADYISKLQAAVTDCKPSSSYAEQNRIPDIGTRVMGWFAKQEQWCRAEVTKICGVCRDNPTADGASVEASITVEVKRLDHGDTACLSVGDIKELTQQMADVPLQAMQVSLANVTPVNGKDWSEEAVGWFRAMVHNRTLFARFYTQESSVEVELFLEKGRLGAMRRGASVSVRLAQNGHAKHSQLKHVGVVKQSKSLYRSKVCSNWEKYLISHYTQYKL
ncbi:unnamed protein product [Lampetra planeri]